jgi:hypothetical protein
MLSMLGADVNVDDSVREMLFGWSYVSARHHCNPVDRQHVSGLEQA